jgi:hypothetical protein
MMALQCPCFTIALTSSTLTVMNLEDHDQVEPSITVASFPIALLHPKEDATTTMMTLPW